MKKFQILTIVIALALTFSACESKPIDKAPEETSSQAEVVSEEVSEDVSMSSEVIEESKTESSETEKSSKELINDRVNGLTLNEYPNIEISGAILERKAILPGTAFKVHFTVKNNGDKAVGYTHGSGSAVIPMALMISSEEVQAVIPKEELGAMTMDLQPGFLEPGESKEFVYNFIAIKPIDGFDEMAMEYMKETGEYIGEKNVDIISEKIDGLEKVTPGEYSIDAYFTYTLADADGKVMNTNNPTGYNIASVNVTVQ